MSELYPLQISPVSSYAGKGLGGSESLPLNEEHEGQKLGMNDQLGMNAGHVSEVFSIDPRCDPKGN